ncbi:PLP-dependent cysteine synthase family protein [Fluviispira multicolorata]|uniref:L-cysteine desulfhydrase Cds1 n=1 Tax=Fluviispira multicolorata TaxID=2654512 RepID=A0A833JFK2_9BACT|nr:PLP-dependent cysteine synthase family protein [Fluviispira multicolorata]KAB8033801.1 pyridoxal-phosphate dependent enzyme [Fluviispira multicolorata]
MTQAWLKNAIKKINADFNRSADTHLIKANILGIDEIDIYFKDEAAHPTGSLKHRLARSLFLYALCNGWINEKSTIIEASSGSTAVSEAYFARMLGLKFIAVMPKNTSKEKIAKIEFYGGKCHLVENATHVSNEAEKLSKNRNCHFMDQFTYAERATDWRGNNNIAESIFQQMGQERFPIPSWVVIGAGTGGTSATIGRYIRYQGYETKVCVVDPDNSVFYDYYNGKASDETILKQGSCIEGIGRPRVEKSFIKNIIDHMIHVPDSASLAAMHFLANELSYARGPSTGTNFYGVYEIVQKMKMKGEKGSIVMLFCDSSSRYLKTYYDKEWMKENNFELEPYYSDLKKFFS